MTIQIQILRSTGLALAILFTLAVAARAATAEERTARVLQIGGQVSNMFVVLSQTIGTEPGCPSARLIVNAGSFSDADSFKRFQAAMWAAKTTGVTVTIYSSGCYSSGFPTMIPTDYYWVNES